MSRVRAVRDLAGALAVACVLASCTDGAPGDGALFVDATASSGIEFRLERGARGDHFLVETVAGGAGWLDHDGDGDLDLYLANGHSDPLHAGAPGAESDRLFSNEGGGRFRDVTDAAGVGDRRWGNGVAVGDADGDGRDDILVLNYGRNTLYRNRGDGTFADVSEAAGLVEEGYAVSASWFDMDNDGDLDVYVARYVVYSPATSRRCAVAGKPVYCHPRYFAGEHDLLYRNRGDGTFEEIGAAAGIRRAGPHEGKGLGVVTFDFDRDGLVDIYVANDTTPNFLWRNRGDGTFVDVAHERGVALGADGQAQAGMGVDLADANADGFTDITVTNFSKETNALYLGSSTGDFIESSRGCGLGASFLPLGFGTRFIDVDLDGDEDIVVANGHVDDSVDSAATGESWAQPMSLWLNDGRGGYSDGAALGGRLFTGRAVVSRGLAGADYDDDGDIDLALVTHDAGLILLRAEPPRGRRSLTVRLLGLGGNRDALGARVEVTVGESTRVWEYQRGRSYASSADPRLVIGLGERDAADLVRVTWQDGRVTERRDAPAGVLTVRRPEALSR